MAHALDGGWALRLSPWARFGLVDGNRALDAADTATDTSPHTTAGTTPHAGAPHGAMGAASSGGGMASNGWNVIERSEGVRLGVLGLYNSGKTFVLNQLSELRLPSSRRVATKGISLRRASLGGCAHTMLLDTEGAYAPVHSQEPGAMDARLQAEAIIENVTARLSDYVLYVVDDFSSVDQRAVHRLARQIRERKDGFAELIVIHNLRTVGNALAFEHVWRTQILELYPDGEELVCVVPIRTVGDQGSSGGGRQGGSADDGGGSGGSGGGANVADGGEEGGNASLACRVRWFKTHNVRHVVLINDNSALGQVVNPGTIALVRQWILSAFVPSTLGRPPLLAQLLAVAETVLSEAIKMPIGLAVEATTDHAVRVIRGATIGSAHDAPRRRAAAAVHAAAARHAAAYGYMTPPSVTDEGSTTRGPNTTRTGAAAAPGGPLAARSAALHLPAALSEPTVRLISEGGEWLPSVDVIEGRTAFEVHCLRTTPWADTPPLAPPRADTWPGRVDLPHLAGAGRLARPRCARSRNLPPRSSDPRAWQACAPLWGRHDRA